MAVHMTKRQCSKEQPGKWELTLCDLAVGSRARVLFAQGDRFLKKRLMELGFVRGTEVFLEKVAPLGDPMDFLLKGYHVCLRRDEARNIVIEPS